MEGEANEGMVNKIIEAKANQFLKKMKKNRALGPSDIPIKVWSFLGESGVCWLTHLFNKILA